MFVTMYLNNEHRKAAGMQDKHDQIICVNNVCTIDISSLHKGLIQCIPKNFYFISKAYNTEAMLNV